MYKFPLASVLTHRKFIEENHQRELGILKRALVNERKKLANYERDKRSLLRELQVKQEKCTTISESLLYVRFLEQLSRRLDEQKNEVFESEKKVARKREELIEATKSRKTLEKLKEKSWKSYKQLMAKKEMNFMNEIAALRFERMR